MNKATGVFTYNRHVIRFTIWIFIIALCMPVYSSISKIDSLKQLVSNSPDNKDKVDNLHLLTHRLAAKKSDEAWTYYNEARQLSEKLDYSAGIVDSYYELGYIYWRFNKVDSAIYFYENYFHLCDSLLEGSGKIKAYWDYGNAIRYKGEREQALVYYRKNIKHFLAVGDTFQLLKNFNSMGITFNQLTKYDSTIHYYLKALQLADLIGQEKNTGSLLVNIGKTHFKLKHYSEAKRFLNNSLPINLKYERMNNVGLAYTLLGNVANEERDLEKALEYYQLAENIYTKIGYSRGLADLYNNYSEFYQKQGKYQLAIENYDKALAYYESTGYYYGIITTKTNKAAILVEIKQYHEAEKIYDSCLNIAILQNDLFIQEKIYGNLADLMKLKGDFEQAYNYQLSYNTIHDTIFSISRAEIMAEMQLKYERQVDQAKILEQELDLKKSDNERNIFLFSGIGSIVVLLLLFAYHKNASRKNKIIADQTIHQLEEEKKLLAAKFLVEGEEKERKRIAKELHDGLGVLLSTAKMQFTAIKDKSPENKPLIDKARNLLEQAAGDVRKISHNMMPGLLTRYGFYEAVEDLFEKIDDTEGLAAHAGISGDKKRLAENTEIMLYRIVQEMANNTIKHSGATEVNIDIVILPEQLSVDYTDNGKGFDVENMLAKKSIGLTSIQSRVKFLNGNLDIHSKANKGVNYHITIPLKSS